MHFWRPKTIIDTTLEAPKPARRGVSGLIFKTTAAVSLLLNVAFCGRDTITYAISPTMQAGVEELGYSETAEKLEEWNTVRFKYENIATKFAVQQMLRWIRYAIEQNFIAPPPPKPVKPIEPPKPESTDWYDPRTWSMFK